MNIVINPYIRFLENILDKERVKSKYKPEIDKFTVQEKEDLVKKIDESINNFGKDERYKKYADFLREYYFNPAIYNTEMPFKTLAEKIKKGGIEILNFNGESISAIRVHYKNSIEKYLWEIIDRYNPDLIERLKSIKNKRKKQKN